MERTAIQELIDDIKENNRHHYEANIVWFEKLIEKEKQQIIDAFGVGCQVESTRLIGYQGMAEQYYNEKFKQD